MFSTVIFTLNEEINLPHCLLSLAPCDDVVVVDSFSTDRTQELARASGARFFQHVFTGFGDQRQWAFSNIEFRYPWILVLDADERLTPELYEEMISKLQSVDQEVGAFRLKRRFFWNGQWLKHANLYPSWVVRLVHKNRITWHNRGHAETQTVRGKIQALNHDLLDENHKGYQDWLIRQWKYAEQEAKYEKAHRHPIRWIELRSADPLVRRAAWKQLISRLPWRGSLFFFYTYLFRGGFLDGQTGLQFCLEKARFQQHIQNLVKS